MAGQHVLEHVLHAAANHDIHALLAQQAHAVKGIAGAQAKIALRGHAPRLHAKYGHRGAVFEARRDIFAEARNRYFHGLVSRRGKGQEMGQSRRTSQNMP